MESNSKESDQYPRENLSSFLIFIYPLSDECMVVQVDWAHGQSFK